MYYVCVDVFVVCYKILYFCNKTFKTSTVEVAVIVL